MDARVILMLCSVVALSSACCTPDQWEGGQGSVGGYADRKRHGIIREFLEVAYDAVNNRTAAFLDYKNGPESSKFQIVTRYDNGTQEGKLYVFDIRKDRCWTKTVKRPFRKACIPEDAKSIGTYFIGLSGGLNATGYELRYRDLEFFVSVQKLDDTTCVPIGENIVGKLRKVDFIQTVGFINITPGIRNETVFNIPEKCQKQMEEYDLPEELVREHYIMAI